MPKRSSKKKDTQQLARSILDAIVPDAEPKDEQPEKNPAAVGAARAASLTKKRRSEFAKKAAAARWKSQC